MFKNFSIIFINFKFFDNIDFTRNKSFLSWFKEFMVEDSYKKITIDEKEAIFYTKLFNEMEVDTFLLKEPKHLNG